MPRKCLHTAKVLLVQGPFPGKDEREGGARGFDFDLVDSRRLRSLRLVYVALLDYQKVILVDHIFRLLLLRQRDFLLDLIFLNMSGRHNR